MSRRTALALIVAACAATFANTLWNGFHLDDFYRVVDNPGIHRVLPLGRHFLDPRTSTTLDRLTQYRPLLPLTLSLNYAVAGDSLPGYHLVNLALQALASVLVYLLLRELLARRAGPGTPGPGVALAAALWFAVHPVSGIAVNYICARDLQLMQVFLLGSLLAFARLRRDDRPTAAGWAASLGLLVLSLMSKTNGAALPALVALWELLACGRSWRDRRVWLRTAPFVAVVGAFWAFQSLVVRFNDLGSLADAGLDRRTYLLTQPRVHLLHYLANFAWPFPIRQDPLIARAQSLFEPGVVAGLLVLAGMAALALRWWRRRPVWAFGLLAYLALILPESSVIPLWHLAAHYRPWPGSAFLFLTLAAAGAHLLPAKAARAGAVALTVYFAGTSLWLNRTWRTEETLWTHSVRHGGTSLAHMNLAMSIADRADPRVRANLEEAVRLEPGAVLPHVNLGLWLVNAGRTDAGLAELATAVRLAPSWPQPHYWTGKALEKLGRKAEAARAYAQAARLDPKNLRHQLEAALAAQRAEDWAGSLGFARTARALDPQDAQALFAEGFARQKLGDAEGAVAAYRAALARDPGLTQVRFNAAYALKDLGRCAEAVPLFQQVLAAWPANRDARARLAECHEALGNAEAAARERAASGEP